MNVVSMLTAVFTTFVFIVHFTLDNQKHRFSSLSILYPAIKFFRKFILAAGF